MKPPSPDTLELYDYADDALLRLHLHGRDRADIRRVMLYGRDVNRFGRRMMAHQNRVARDGADFLRFLGYGERAARNFRAAMMLHDIGKIHPDYDPALWMLDDRPDPVQKALQKRHARYGAEMLEDFARALPDLAEHPHIGVRYALTRYHHERLDGRGPEGLDAAALPEYVQVACIVDAYDGDLIPRPHQKEKRTPAQALRRMAGRDDPHGKYDGAFDARLLARYTEMKAASLGLRL